MYYECDFDPLRDIEPCEDCLSIDISECLKNGVVPATGVDVDFNHLEVESITGRVGDAFDAIDKARSLSKSMKASAPSASPAVESTEKE